ncbi:hypothetical protein [Roseibium sp. RKSG952]|uniref:hypothetical protein n=1 Tax=Roseibium sp. RKSG952 TaxID=2529384 RepID=UPI0012BCA675|nr:hypothetical protein [Roseibium sp. RKSG952]MTH96042.1 hypothetical protein [Roseibium sp. RKSG952]
MTCEKKRDVFVTLFSEEIFDIELSRLTYASIIDVTTRIALTEQEQQEIVNANVLGKADVETFIDIPYHLLSSRGPSELESANYILNEDGTLEREDRLEVTLFIDEDFHSFPFGRLRLVQAVEFLDTHLGRRDCFDFKIADTRDLPEPMVVAGAWHIVSQEIKQPSDDTISLTTTLRHDYVNIFFKFAFPLLLITALSIAIAVSIRHKEDLSDAWRVSGQVALLLVAITLRIAIGNELPQVHYLTFADIFWIFVLLIVTISGLATIALRFALEDDDPAAELRVANRFRVLLMLGYAAAIAVCLLLLDSAHLHFS